MLHTLEPHSSHVENLRISDPHIHTQTERDTFAFIERYWRKLNSASLKNVSAHCHHRHHHHHHHYHHNPSLSLSPSLS